VSVNFRVAADLLLGVGEDGPDGTGPQHTDDDLKASVGSWPEQIVLTRNLGRALLR
jgi:hypothetical protein